MGDFYVEPWNQPISGGDGGVIYGATWEAAIKDDGEDGGDNCRGGDTFAQEAGEEGPDSNSELTCIPIPNPLVVKFVETTFSLQSRLTSQAYETVIAHLKRATRPNLILSSSEAIERNSLSGQESGNVDNRIVVLIHGLPSQVFVSFAVQLRLRKFLGQKVVFKDSGNSLVLGFAGVVVMDGIHTSVIKFEASHVVSSAVTDACLQQP
ncbi:hypothetical protein L2E82_23267 [Cichorium intybus]|uniref:Uncharacterized protein n=1 Tax=Cichorium intybus TaxID=13427 RepID=A0ACB9E099_CICIN|nr:hypothetical protein L2E82_23267 [Cichorium intybus]